MPAAGPQNTRKAQIKRKRVVKVKPGPTNTAQSYVSQGKAVERVANHQKAKAKAKRTRQHQVKDTKSDVEIHAGAKVKASPEYFQARVEARHSRYKNASPAQRKKIFGNPSKDSKNPKLLKRFKSDVSKGALVGAGDIPALTVKNFAGAVSSIPDIAKATYHHPGKVGGSTAKSLPGLAASTIAGLAEVPIKVAEGKSGDLAKQMVSDSNRRYDATSKQKQKRYTKEGIASEAIDLAPVAVGAGEAVGTGLSAVAKAGRVTRAAERGSKVAKVVQAPTKARPKLRKAAGDQGAVEQDLSPNYLKAVTQKAVDRGRAKKHAKRAAKVDQGGEAVPVRGLVPGKGEVVKKRLVLQRRDQRVDVSRGAARGHEAQKRAQDRELRSGVEKERRKLSKDDKRIETLALQGLIHFDSPETTRHLLTAYREKIVAARAAEDARVVEKGGTPHKIPKKSDELARIDETLAKLKEDPSSVLTPTLRDFHASQVDRYHRLREADNVNATDLTAEVRRHQPLGRVLGEHEALDEALAAIDRQPKEAFEAVDARVKRMEAQRAKVGARHQVHRGQANGSLRSYLVDDARFDTREAAVAHAKAAGVSKSRIRVVARTSAEARRTGEENRLDRAIAAAKKERDEKRHAISSPEAVAKRDKLKDRARTQFVTRTRAHMERLGLPEPVYVGHRARSKASFGSYSAGGAKAIQGVKKSEFKLFDQGRADTTGAAYSDALAQGIKRNVNWNTVADTFEKHTPEWGRNKSSEELAKAIDDKGLAPGDWRVVDLGRFRKAAKGAGTADDVAVQGDSGVHSAVKASTHTLDGVPAEFAQAKLSLVPKGVADELEAMTKPSGKTVRTLQKVQGIQSKLILGTNPSFVPVQTAANTVQTALATKGNLLNIVKGHKAWKHLDQPTKDWVETRLGVSSASDAANFRPKYGALNNESSALLHNYRVFKDSRPVQGVKTSRANPLNWNHRLDDLQNNFFRRITVKESMAREARQLARHMDATKQSAKPLLDVLKMPDGPEKIVALRKAEPQIDKMAEHVNSMLGDYSRFTARERKIARTTLLFYPFLRWALKFTFYTLPVKHPMAAAITAKLGQLHREEVVNLLGKEIVKKHGGTQAQAEQAVREFAPSYAYGRIYYNGDKLQSIDFSRINPLATQAFDVVPQAGEGGLIHGGLKTALGSFSPLGISLLKAAQGRDPVTGLPLNVGGAKTPFGSSTRMTTGREVGVIGRDLANLNPISRTALKIKDKGKMQGDDLSTIKRNLTGNDAKKLKARAQAQGSTGETVLDAAIPFRKKGDLGADTIYRHAISDQLSKIGEAKSKLKKGTPKYQALTAKESDLKRKIGALPPRKIRAAGTAGWSGGGSQGSWGDQSSQGTWGG